MKINKVITTVILAILIVGCLFALCSCKTKCDDVCTTTTEEENVSFGKKYYALSGDGLDKNQYYQFNKDGTATYNVTLEEDGQTTFKSVVNFKWFYAGNGEYIMLHNGTRVLQGEQDDAMGFGRVMHTTKCAMYWGNMYYVSEDCVNAISNYGKLLGNARKLLELKK